MCRLDGGTCLSRCPSPLTIPVLFFFSFWGNQVVELPSLHGLSGHPRVPPECTVVFSSPTLWSSRVSVRVAHQPGLLLLMCLPSAHHFFPRASRRCVLLCRRVKGFFLSMPVKGFHFFPPFRRACEGFSFFPPLGAREGYFLSFFFCGGSWLVFLGLWCVLSRSLLPVLLVDRSMWCSRPVFIRAGGLSRARRGTDIHGEWRPLFSFCQRAPRLASPP